MDLQDRIVVITGASMGIGAATAREFARVGAKVVSAARSAKLLDALAAELDADQVLTVATDVATGQPQDDGTR